MRSAADLPDDIEALKQIVIARETELAAVKAGLVTKTLETEKLRLELARLRRLSFGQSSERFAHEIEQLDEPASCACPCCGSERMRKVGEDVTEVLEYIPSRFEVVRHVRPAYSCAKCEAMAQAPMPSLPIPRAMAGASTIAHVVMAKYADHPPLYRQSAIYASDGVDLDRALLADWVGKAAWLIRPLVERISAHVMAGEVIHADDTPVPVLAPGSGKTRTGAPVGLSAR